MQLPTKSKKFRSNHNAMTKEEKQTLHLFETRVRQLILKYKTLEQEAQDLHAMVEKQEKTIEQLTQDNENLQTKYNDLKVAKMIEITSQENENAQKRISKLIREIDKCIALINI